MLQIEITAFLIERATLTGHPRLLAKLLKREPPIPGSFEGIDIVSINIVGIRDGIESTDNGTDERRA